MWTLVDYKNYISTYELARDLEVTQKTAWFMLYRLKLAMRTGTFEKLHARWKRTSPDRYRLAGLVPDAGLVRQRDGWLLEATANAESGYSVESKRTRFETFVKKIAAVPKEELEEKRAEYER